MNLREKCPLVTVMCIGNNGMTCHQLPFYMTGNSANKSCYLEKEYGVDKSLPLNINNSKKVVRKDLSSIILI